MRNFLMVGIAGVLAVLCSVGGYRFYMASQFTASYKAYAEIAAAHSNAAFMPAAENNPVRQELNRALLRVLSDTTMSNAERLALAEQGLDLLKQVEEQIDAIGEAGERVEGAIAGMEADASGSARSGIVSLARERFEIIADIRGLSYRANYHTAEIFNRIIKDNGKLTDAHVSELNDQVPLVEEQFDRRTNLYTDLENADFRIGSAYADLGML